MSEQEILIEVAKIDGWKLIQKDVQVWACTDYDGSGEYQNKTVPMYENDGAFKKLENLPRYTTSHDAILPVVGRQDMTTEFTKKFMDHLNLEIKWSPSRDLNMLLMLTATPLQLCTALLKAKGVWREA